MSSLPVCATCAHTLRRMVLCQTSTEDPWREWFELEGQRALSESEDLFRIEWQRALDMGHDMGLMENDSEPGTHIAMCHTCGGWLVMDANEYDDISMKHPTPFYGRAYQKECPGAPPPRPAVRRLLTDMAAPSTSLSHEAADRHPPYIPKGYGQAWD